MTDFCPPLYWCGRLLCSALAAVFFRLRVTGCDHVPALGRVLLLGNHLSVADPLFLAVAVRRPVQFMAMAEMFASPVVARLLRWAGAFPVDRWRIDPAAVREAIRRLEAGGCVGMFPEGGIRLGDRSVLGGKPVIADGASVVAWPTRATVVPVVLQGSRAAHYLPAWWRRPAVSVQFGPAFCLWAPPGQSAAQRRATGRAVLRAALLNTVEVC